VIKIIFLNKNFIEILFYDIYMLTNINSISTDDSGIFRKYGSRPPGDPKKFAPSSNIHHVKTCFIFSFLLQLCDCFFRNVAK